MKESLERLDKDLHKLFKNGENLQEQKSFPQKAPKNGHCPTAKSIDIARMITVRLYKKSLYEQHVMYNYTTDKNNFLTIKKRC